MSRHFRIEQFNLLEDLFSKTNTNLRCNSAKVVNPLDIKIKPSNSLDQIVFIEKNIINTLLLFENPTVLVFCSAKNPGGGIKRGAIAQEESISLHTTWYFQIKDIKNFYLKSKESSINTDKMIYIDKGFLLTDPYHNKISPTPLSFIGATAINLNGLKDQGIDISKINYKKIMRFRIENILKLAQFYNKKTLILGAFGCGIFGLNPYDVAEIFAEQINKKIFDGKIVFSIPDEKIMSIFKETIRT